MDEHHLSVGAHEKVAPLGVRRLHVRAVVRHVPHALGAHVLPSDVGVLHVEEVRSFGQVQLDPEDVALQGQGPQLVDGAVDDVAGLVQAQNWAPRTLTHT